MMMGIREEVVINFINPYAMQYSFPNCTVLSNE